MLAYSIQSLTENSNNTLHLDNAYLSDIASISDMSKNGIAHIVKTAVSPDKLSPIVISSKNVLMKSPTPVKLKAVTMGVGIGSTYKFSKAEVDRCYRIGKARNDANIAEGKTNMRFSNRDDVVISCQGILGEAAFMRMFGQDDETLEDTTCRNASNDTFDATLDGHSVDVKTVLRPGLDLIATSWKAKNPASLYAMMWLHGLKQSDLVWRDDLELSCTFLGMMPGAWLFKPENVKTMFAEQKEFYCWPSARLVTWDYLMRKQTEEEMEEQKDKLMKQVDEQLAVTNAKATAKLNSGSCFF
jgi:hypothetical protein